MPAGAWFEANHFPGNVCHPGLKSHRVLGFLSVSAALERAPPPARVGV